MRYIDINTGQELTEEEERDIEHPYYAKFRQPATRAVEQALARPLSIPFSKAQASGVPGPLAKWAARKIVPQEPYWAAALPASVAAAGLGIPWWLAAPMVGATGATTAALTGDTPSSAGFETGAAELGGRAINRWIVNPLLRSKGSPIISSSTTRGIADEMSNALSRPGLRAQRFTEADLHELAQGKNIFGYNYHRAIPALREVFNPANEIFDPQTGLLNQPNLIRQLELHRDALTRDLGPDAFQRLYDRARRLPIPPPGQRLSAAEQYRRAIGPTSDVPSEKSALSLHPAVNPAHAVRIHAGSPTGFINAPLWARPSPSIMTYFVTKPEARRVFGAAPVAGPPPEGTPEE